MDHRARLQKLTLFVLAGIMDDYEAAALAIEYRGDEQWGYQSTVVGRPGLAGVMGEIHR